MSVSQAQNFYKETVTIAWATGAGNFYVSVKPTISSGYIVISPNNIALREIVKFTAVGTDGSGDYVTITAPNRGLGGTTDKTHVVGESVFINVTAQHIDEIIADLALKLDDSQLDIDGTLAANDDTKIASQKATKTYADTKVSKTGNETIAGVKTFSSSPVVPAPTADFEAATKKYADDLAIAGAPNASETVKGIVEMATTAQAEAGTDTGETGALLVVKPSDILAIIAANIPAVPTPKMCRVYQNAATSFGTANTDGNAMAFQVEAFDTDGFHDNVTNNSRITIPTSGKYLVGASVLNPTSNSSTRLQIKLNGSTFIGGTGFVGNNGISPTASVSTLYDFTAGDYVEIFCAATSGVPSSSGDARTNFWITSID